MLYKKICCCLSFIVCLGLGSSSFADQTKLTSQPSSAGQPASSTHKNTLPTLFCPPLNRITKNAANLWVSSYGGAWKSFNESFAKELVQFKGAQWKGVGVGNIVCIYIAKNKTTFPVQLIYSVLTKNPTETKKILQKSSEVPINWQEKSYIEEGQKQILSNCKSKQSDTRNCPFMPGVLKKEENINKALRDTKKNYRTQDIPNL